MKNISYWKIILCTTIFLFQCKKEDECGGIVNIPDSNFLNNVVNYDLSGGYGNIIDDNHDGKIQYCEIENIFSFSIFDDKVKDKLNLEGVFSSSAQIVMGGDVSGTANSVVIGSIDGGSV